MADRQTLIDAYRRAESANDRPAMTALKQALDQMELTSTEMAVGTARNIAQGLTYNTADEIESAVRATLGMGQGGTWPERYRQAQQEYAAQQQRFMGNAPILGTAAMLGGGLLGGGLAAGPAMASQFGRMNPYLTATLVGAGEGAASGAGMAPTMADVPMEATKGAVLGGVAAPLMMGAMDAAAGGIKGIGRLFQSGVTVPKSQAQREVRRAFIRDEMTPALFAERVREAGGPGNARLVDVGRENVKGLGRTIIDQPGPARTMAKDLVENRQLLQQPRMTGDMQRILGTTENYFQALDDIVARRKALSKPLYTAAHQETLKVTPKMADLLETRPMMQSAFNVAKRDAQNRGLPFLTDIPKAGDDMPVAMADFLARNLRDKQAGLSNPASMKRSQAGNALDLRDQWLGEVKPQSDNLTQAMQIFAGQSSLKDSLEAGITFDKLRPEEIRKYLSNRSIADKDVFIIGALRNLTDKLERAGETRNASIQFAPTILRNKIREAFPDANSFEQFMDMLKREGRYAETSGALFGGSPTSRLIQGQEDLANPILTLVDATVSSPTQVGIGLIRRWLGAQKQIPDEVKAEFGNLLFQEPITPELLKRLRPYNVPASEIEKLKNILAVASGHAVSEQVQRSTARPPLLGGFAGSR